MKKPLSIIRHTINHIAFIVWAVVINEKRLALSKPIEEFTYQSGPVLLDEHSETMGLVKLYYMISTSLSYPL